MKFPLLILFSSLICIQSQAQKALTLSECIAIAKEENIGLKRGALDVKIQEENLNQVRANRYPTLNFIGTNNYNFGQRIDPFTNQFASTRVRSNSFSFNTDVDLFRGFQIQNSIEQQEKDVLISVKRMEVMENDIALAVAAAYLQVLLQEEIVTLMENELQIASEQLKQTSTLIESGALADGELLNSQSQQARNRANLVSAENLLQMNLLDLKQLMRIPADRDFQIAKPEIAVTEENESGVYNADYIYNQSEQNLPEIKVAEYTVESTEKALDVAKGSRSPVLRLGASYGTGYSGARTRVINTAFAGLSDEVGETASGESIFLRQFNSTTEVVPFSQQLENNLNQTIGLSLTIPIFNNFSSSTSIHVARLRNEQALFDLDQSKQDLRNKIERARNDVVTSLSNYRALETSMEAMQRSYEYSSERFEAGLLPVLDLNQEKNNLLRAESELLQAKYDYVFKLKILDFYLGKPISLQ